MKQFFGEKGFSLLEIMGTIALSAVVVMGGYAVLTRTSSLDRQTEYISLVDTEFAAGLQIAQNPPRLAPYVGIADLGDCLHGQSGTSCKSFSAWKDLPDAPEPAPKFHSKLGLRGPCPPNLDCPVTRRMRYRWVCTDTSCTNLEVEVKVTSAKPGGKKGTEVIAKERTSITSLDRRRFLDRGQLKFLCDAAGQSVVGVDYGKLKDQCQTLPISNCELPHAHHSKEDIATDCQPPVTGDCGTGFSTLGLHQAAPTCVSGN